jgi:transcriptional regulator with PAS, ATPase and Fis domain
MVQDNTFRRDLFYRLNVIPIHIPPLRNRKEDIALLARHFLEKYNREIGKRFTTITDNAMQQLMAYDWPGNVRELENVIERAMILHRDGQLRFDDLGASLAGKTSAVTPVREAEPLELDVLVKSHIQRVLTLANGKIHGPGGAGELLGVNPDTLRYRMKKLGIPFRKQKKKS